MGKNVFGKYCMCAMNDLRYIPFVDIADLPTVSETSCSNFSGGSYREG